jgi:hypothetical protein
MSRNNRPVAYILSQYQPRYFGSRRENGRGRRIRRENGREEGSEEKTAGRKDPKTGEKD